MLETAYLLLFPFVMAWLNVQRGLDKAHESITKPVALVLMGSGTALFFGYPDLNMGWLGVAGFIGFSVVFSALHGIGFGEPVGHALTGIGGQRASDGSVYESWQILPILRSNPWVAVAVRGAMLGGAAVVLMDWRMAWQISLAWAFAFPLSIAITRFWIAPRWSIGTGEVQYQAACGLLSSVILISLRIPA